MPNEFTPPLPPGTILPEFSNPEETRREASKVAESAVHQARNNPWPVLAGALVLGIAVGVAVARRDKEAVAVHPVEGWISGAKARLGCSLPAMRKQLLAKSSNGHSLAGQARDLGHRLHLW